MMKWNKPLEAHIAISFDYHMIYVAQVERRQHFTSNLLMPCHCGEKICRTDKFNVYFSLSTENYYLSQEKIEKM